MGASIFIYWPDATEDEQTEHPGFVNDDDPYASWLEECLVQGDRFQSLGIQALLACCDYEDEPEEENYTTPEALREAAQTLIDILKSNPDQVHNLLEIYEENSIGEDEPEIELAQDLADVQAIAEYAKDCGAKKLILKIGW
jgi:predicted xylose isomerase-like sugar epimerase